MLENNQKEIILLKDLGYLFPTEKSKQKAKYGLYRCYCGNEFKTQIPDVKKGKTKSCGCYQKQRVVDTLGTHGLSNHRLYDTWNNIMGRCYNKNLPNYKDYGARGITVCERWLNVKNFIEDMYPSYQEGLSIDRINNDKGYYKDNCRWTNQIVQSRNTRVLYSHNTSGYRGVFKCKKTNKWASQISINNKNIRIGYFDTIIEAVESRDKYVIDNNLEHTLNKDLLI